MSPSSIAVAAGLAAALLLPAAPASAAADPACNITYKTYGDTWNFNGDIIITNTGQATLYGWTLKFTLPTEQRWINGWEARFTVDGQDVTGVSLPYNSEVARGVSKTVGFHGSGSARAPRPTGFTINDEVCSVS